MVDENDEMGKGDKWNISDPPNLSEELDKWIDYFWLGYTDFGKVILQGLIKGIKRNNLTDKQRWHLSSILEGVISDKPNNAAKNLYLDNPKHRPKSEAAEKRGRMVALDYLMELKIRGVEQEHNHSFNSEIVGQLADDYSCSDRSIERYLDKYLPIIEYQQKKDIPLLMLRIQYLDDYLKMIDTLSDPELRDKIDEILSKKEQMLELFEVRRGFKFTLDNK